jgi:hypothetical protein
MINIYYYKYFKTIFIVVLKNVYKYINMLTGNNSNLKTASRAIKLYRIKFYKSGHTFIKYLH